MKQTLKILLITHFLIGMFSNYAQIKPSCQTPGETIVWNSDIFNGFDTSRCDNNVEIIASSRDIKIKNHINIKDGRKLVFKTTEDHQISILPEKKDNTSRQPGLDPWNGVGDRITTTGSNNGIDDKHPIQLRLSPNPTNSELQITSNKEIISYQVAGFNGITLLEVTSLSNNTLSVEDLPPGTYFLRIQTEAGPASQFFIKN